MKNKLIILLIVTMTITTGFTIKEGVPKWTEGRIDYPLSVSTQAKILKNIENSLKELSNKGISFSNPSWLELYVSPYKLKGVKGVTFAYQAVIADTDPHIVYHELGHIYWTDNWQVLQKAYVDKLESLEPNITQNHDRFDWNWDIREDFAEEFAKIFTGKAKRTNYPDVPNFYEWLLRNTQPIEITREEVFDKLGGTEKLIKAKIIKGNEKGDYMLSKPITRAEIATILTRLKGLTKEKQVPFTDVKDQWYGSYVRKIYNEGLIKGLPNNTFGGGKLITRYELHMILERIN